MICVRLRLEKGKIMTSITCHRSKQLTLRFIIFCSDWFSDKKKKPLPDTRLCCKLPEWKGFSGVVWLLYVGTQTLEDIDRFTVEAPVARSHPVVGYDTVCQDTTASYGWWFVELQWALCSCVYWGFEPHICVLISETRRNKWSIKKTFFVRQ